MNDLLEYTHAMPRRKQTTIAASKPSISMHTVSGFAQTCIARPAKVQCPNYLNIFNFNMIIFYTNVQFSNSNSLVLQCFSLITNIMNINVCNLTLVSGSNLHSRSLQCLHVY